MKQHFRPDLPPPGCIILLLEAIMEWRFNLRLALVLGLCIVSAFSLFPHWPRGGGRGFIDHRGMGIDHRGSVRWITADFWQLAFVNISQNSVFPFKSMIWTFYNYFIYLLLTYLTYFYLFWAYFTYFSNKLSDLVVIILLMAWFACKRQKRNLRVSHL